MKPGYLTSEHAVTWAVIGLSAAALWRGHGAVDSLAAVVGPAVASAAYSASRGRVKAPGPFADGRSLARLLGERFRGRVVTSSRTGPGRG